MAYLAAAVVLVGAIGLLNLSLTLAVIRRLRREAREDPVPSVLQSGPEVGAELPEFAGTTLAGSQLSADSLRGSELVFALYSTTCHACLYSVPHLLEYAKSRGLKPPQVVAVIGGDREDAAELIEKLGESTTVIVEPAKGPIDRAFGPSTYPTFVVVDAEGTVTRSGAGMSTLMNQIPV